jgi:uncharacterized protein YceK
MYSYSMTKLPILLILTLVLTGCGSKGDSSDSEESSGGGYIGCVLELYEARNAGIISATDAEIQQECRTSNLP